MRRSPNWALERIQSCSARCCWPAAGLHNPCPRLRGTRRSRGWRRPHQLGAGDHWLQHYAPAISAIDVTRSQNAPLDIADLVEYKDRLTASPLSTRRGGLWCARSVEMGGYQDILVGRRL
jgi:hypothetical protein